MGSANIPNIVNQPAYINSIGAAIPADQLFRASVQVNATGVNDTGTLKLEGSNDISLSSINPPVNWSLIATLDVTGQGAVMIPSTELSYQYIRSTYTSTSPAEQNITTVADVSGSLNNTYFLVYSALDAHKYAVWFNVSGGGVAPTVPGFTVTEVDITTDDTAADVAIALSTVLGALTGLNSSVLSPGLVSVMNTAIGTFTPAVDSVSAPTHFTFALSDNNGTISTTVQVLSA